MTTETRPHAYAEILRAIADGKQVQLNKFLNEQGRVWLDQAAGAALEEISCGLYPPEDFRIKPAFIIVNGVEVPEPVRYQLESDQWYWVAGTSNGRALGWLWGEDSDDDIRRLELGVIHLTQEAAQSHIDAMLKPSRRDQV